MPARSRLAAAPASGAGAEPLLVQVLDGLTDVAVVLLAGWTLVYDLLTPLHLPVAPFLAGWLVLLLVGTAAWLVRAHRRGRTAQAVTDAAATESLLGSRARRAVMVATTVLVALAALSFFGPYGSWPVRFLLSLLALLGTVILALSARRRPQVQPGAGAVPGPAHLVAVALAVLAAVLSVYIRRPDDDDVYYVNRATWVAQHGTVPLRDTMFGNMTVPAIPGGGVPLSSFEALQGGLARLVHLPAPTVVYELGLPVVTFLAAWSLWRLVRAWAPRARLAGLGLAMVLLFWTNAASGSFGVFFAPRLWQGKAVLVSVLVPVLYVRLTSWSRRHDRGSLLLVVAASVAGIGLSSSGVFVVPLCLAAAGIGVLLRGDVRGLLAPVLGLIYPLGCVVATHFLSTASLPTGGATRDGAGILDLVVGSGAIAVLVWLAVLLAPLATVDKTAGALLAGAAVVAVLVLTPGVPRLVNAATGAGPVLWRVLWVLPVPALVALLPGALAGLVGTVVRIDQPVLQPASSIAAALALALVVAVTGAPVWSPLRHAEFGPPGWKVNEFSLLLTNRILARGPYAGPVLAPQRVMSTMATVTTRTHAVVPRAFYLTTPPLLPADRAHRAVLDRLESRPREVTATQVRNALAALSVSLVCVTVGNRQALDLLTSAGWTTPVPIAALRCRRPG